MIKIIVVVTVAVVTVVSYCIYTALVNWFAKD